MEREDLIKRMQLAGLSVKLGSKPEIVEDEQSKRKRYIEECRRKGWPFIYELREQLKNEKISFPEFLRTLESGMFCNVTREEAMRV